MPEMLDISYWQGKVSVAAFQSMTGIDRVVLRASRADGALAQDSTYATSVANARAAGKKIGHYHFNGQKGSIQQQADFFLSHVSIQPGDVVVLDIETTAGIARRFTPAEAVEWLDRVRAAVPGVELWVYMSQSVTNEANWSEVAKRAKLWVASYTKTLGKLGYWSTYVAWQYTSSGRVPGIGGGVDLSRYGSDTVGGTTGGGAVAAPVVNVTVNRSVKDIQAKLISLGYDLGPTGADGQWGPKTDAAVGKFQSDHGLNPDTIWGPRTDAAAFGAAGTQPQVGPAALALDGKLGPNTIKRWQQVLGTTPDGVISTPSALVKAVQSRCNAQGFRDWDGHSLQVDGLGIRQDGSKTRTIWALQAYLGTPRDGVLTPTGSAAIVELQRRLNGGGY